MANQADLIMQSHHDAIWAFWDQTCGMVGLGMIYSSYGTECVWTWESGASVVDLEVLNPKTLLGIQYYQES